MFSFSPKIRRSYKKRSVVNLLSEKKSLQSTCWRNDWWPGSGLLCPKASACFCIVFINLFVFALNQWLALRSATILDKTGRGVQGVRPPPFPRWPAAFLRSILQENNRQLSHFLGSPRSKKNPGSTPAPPSSVNVAEYCHLMNIEFRGRGKGGF